MSNFADSYLSKFTWRIYSKYDNDKDKGKANDEDNDIYNLQIQNCTFLNTCILLMIASTLSGLVFIAG